MLVKKILLATWNSFGQSTKWSRLGNLAQNGSNVELATWECAPEKFTHE
jgi:hypothetical protein